MADLIRTQFNETLQASLDAAQFEEWDKALRAIVLRMDTGIYAARAALAASWAASSAAVGGRA